MTNPVTSRTTPAYELWQQAVDHHNQIHATLQNEKLQGVDHVATTPLQHVHDTQAQATPTPEKLFRSPFGSKYLPTTTAAKSKKTVLTPHIDAPEPLTAVQRERAIQALGSHIQEDQVPLDFLLQFLMLHLIQDRSNRLQLYKKLLIEGQQFINTKEQEKLDTVEKLVRESNRVGTLGKVESATSSLGLMAASIAKMAAVGLSQGVAAAFIYSTLLTIDLALDGAGKRQVASWLAQGDKESENNWLGRLQLFTSLTSLFLSFGLCGSKTVQIAQSVSQMTITGLKGSGEQKMLDQRALMLSIDNCIEGSKINTDLFMQQVKDLVRSIYKLYEDIQYVEERRDQILRGMFQSLI